MECKHFSQNKLFSNHHLGTDKENVSLQFDSENGSLGPASEKILSIATDLK